MTKRQKKKMVELGLGLALVMAAGIFGWDLWGEGVEKEAVVESVAIVNQTEATAAAVVSSSSAIVDENGWEKARVGRVVDGDTIVLEDGRKLRYIGVDTPETVDPRRPIGCFGAEASAKNKELMDGQEVWLERDVSETDKYGRLLRYVYIEDESGKKVMVQRILLNEGYAQASRYAPDVKYADEFRKLAKVAAENEIGLWNPTNCPAE